MQLNIAGASRLVVISVRANVVHPLQRLELLERVGISVELKDDVTHLLVMTSCPPASP